MRKLVLALVAMAALVAVTAALLPRDLVATKTVGHQARAHRLRRIEAKPPPEPKICGEGEVSTDRSPCIGVNGRLDYRGDDRGAVGR